MSKRVLILNPASEIKFKGPFNVVSTRNLQLTNPSDQRVAFKIKTTTPKRYCVRPNSGTLKPHENISVSIMFQPHEGDLDKTKHKFMVQWIFLDNDIAAEPIENYWKTATPEMINDTKLKCVFEDEDSPKKSAVAKAAAQIGDVEKVSVTSLQGDAALPDDSAYSDDSSVHLIRQLRSENTALKEEQLRYRMMAMDRSFNLASKLHPSEEAGKGAGGGMQYQQAGVMQYRRVLLMLLMIVIGIFLGKIFF